MQGVVGRVIRIALALALLALGFYCAVHATVLLTGGWGFAWDARAYYEAWQGGGSLYREAPGTFTAFNYSPAFAQVLWPFTLLPWPVFSVLAVGAAAAGMFWLCRPLPPLWFALTLPVWSVQILSGNIDWLLALIAVLGLTSGWPWVVAALTKVVPTLGPVWFVARGEWRRLFGFVLALAGVTAVSVAVGPGHWVDWFEFLMKHSEGEARFWGWDPGWMYRLPVALVVTVVAARTSRTWLLPVAMLLASPMLATGPLALLAAVPRLWVHDAQRGRPAGEAAPVPADAVR